MSEANEEVGSTPAPDGFTIEKRDHHQRSTICTTRAKYREGRKQTAVKVYTINDESRYLLIHKVPAIKLTNELRKLCEHYGDVERLTLAKDYPVDETFTEAFVVKYARLQNAIYAKKKLDDMSFMGSILHVCYAPELESVEETKDKLENRFSYVKTKINRMSHRSFKRAKVDH